MTNFFRENTPKIVSSLEYGKKPILDDLQINVYETMPAVENVTAIYDNKIITGNVHYGDFIVNCYAETRDDAKQWMDNFEQQMVKRNQYRGKCLYAEKNSIFFRDVPKVSWDDIVLSEKIKKDIRLNTVDFLGNKKFATVGVMKRGLLMFGPPGTGKTSVVKSIFNELEGKDISRIYVTAESFRNMSVGRLFEFLGYLGPSVLAFEDIDMISGNRDVHLASNQLGDLLTNLDGMRKHGEQLVVIASTNKIGLMDDALASRPARFDRKIEIGLPDADLVKRLYAKFLGSVVSDDIIKMSSGFTGSHIFEVVNTAKIIASNEDKEAKDCVSEACTIIRDNFFPGQDMLQMKAAIQSYMIKKSSITKKASISKVQKIALNILEQISKD
jgi:SpoVK/Ycf46/Vps4 family AAA+-type ATPase